MAVGAGDACAGHFSAVIAIGTACANLFGACVAFRAAPVEHGGWRVGL
jgi:hypothetical protein